MSLDTDRSQGDQVVLTCLRLEAGIMDSGLGKRTVDSKSCIQDGK